MHSTYHRPLGRSQNKRRGKNQNAVVHFVVNEGIWISTILIILWSTRREITGILELCAGAVTVLATVFFGFLGSLLRRFG